MTNQQTWIKSLEEAIAEDPRVHAHYCPTLAPERITRETKFTFDTDSPSASEFARLAAAITDEQRYINHWRFRIVGPFEELIYGGRRSYRNWRGLVIGFEDYIEASDDADEEPWFSGLSLGD